MLLGVPTALWGAALYGAIGGLAALGLGPRRWRWAFHLAAAGVGVSVYLTALSVLVIHATCAYCLASTGLMLAIFLVLWRSEEHTSELQSHLNLVCRLLLEKKKKDNRSL